MRTASGARPDDRRESLSGSRSRLSTSTIDFIMSSGLLSADYRVEEEVRGGFGDDARIRDWVTSASRGYLHLRIPSARGHIESHVYGSPN